MIRVALFALNRTKGAETLKLWKAVLNHLYEPLVRTDAAGTLSRTNGRIDQGWGVFDIAGKMLIEDRSARILDAELSYDLDSHYFEGRKLPFANDVFPPTMVFFPGIKYRERKPGDA